MRWLATLALALTLLLFATPKARSSPGYQQLVNGFLCIHKGEGAWNANTGNGYYGGLQMDYSFMSAYGREYLRAWGPAHNWPPSIQIAVAIKAYLSGRGYYPWPNTARRCGLI